MTMRAATPADIDAINAVLPHGDGLHPNLRRLWIDAALNRGHIYVLDNGNATPDGVAVIEHLHPPDVLDKHSGWYITRFHTVPEQPSSEFYTDVCRAARDDHGIGFLRHVTAHTDYPNTQVKYPPGACGITYVYFTAVGKRWAMLTINTEPL